MTRALKIVITCDYCDSGIEEGEGHKGSLLLDLNGGGTRQVDLCEECLVNESIGTLRTLYESADVIKQQGGDEPFGCPLCSAAFKTVKGQRRHTTRKHGDTPTDGVESVE